MDFPQSGIRIARAVLISTCLCISECMLRPASAQTGEAPSQVEEVEAWKNPEAPEAKEGSGSANNKTASRSKKSSKNKTSSKKGSQTQPPPAVEEGQSQTETPAPPAEESQVQKLLSRADRRLGFYLGVFGDPFPIPAGLNFAYNVINFARVNVGYGYISLSSVGLKASTLGGGAKFFVPGWELSPVAGINFARVNIKADGWIFERFKEKLQTSKSHAYLNFGADWQAKSGLNLSLGYSMSLLNPWIGFPYLNFGWFF